MYAAHIGKLSMKPFLPQIISAITIQRSIKPKIIVVKLYCLFLFLGKTKNNINDTAKNKANESAVPQCTIICNPKTLVDGTCTHVIMHITPRIIQI